MAGETWRTYSNAVRQVLIRPDLAARFQEDVEGDTVLPELPADMRHDLKNLLVTLSARGAVPAATGDADAAGDDRFDASAMSAERFFEETYGHLRRGALVATVMSVLIFLMGLFLLGVAAVQSLVGNGTGPAIVLASSGIVAIAAAFYRSPVTQIRESAAEVQRSSMVLMSYMLGVSLLGRSLSTAAADGETLVTLTQRLIALLPPGPTRAPEKPATGETGRPATGGTDGTDGTGRPATGES